MQQMKLFKGVESQLEMLEAEINEWMSTSGARVVSMNANIAPQTPRGQAGHAASGRAFDPSDVLIAIVYETV